MPFIVIRYLPALLVLASGLSYGSAADARTIAHTAIGAAVFCKQQLHGKMLARTELIFGLSQAKGGSLSEQTFQHFVDTEITPRFPAGLTVLAAKGQFRASTGGTIIQEASKVVLLLYPFSNKSNQAIEQIRKAYKNSFQQMSVLRIDGRSCVSF